MTPESAPRPHASKTSPADSQIDPKLPEKIHRLALRWHGQHIDEPCLAAGYFLLWQIARHGQKFSSRISRSQPRPNPTEVQDHLLNLEGTDLRDWTLKFIQQYQHHKTSPEALNSLSRWLSGDKRIHLLTRIPSPIDVLEMQCEGLRPATVILNFPRALKPILNKPDGFAFLVHDLEHATRFHQDPKCHALQVNLFKLLRKSLDKGLFEEALHEPEFVKSLNYLISDMNTHPVHSLRYLHAVLIEYLLRSEGKSPDQRLSPNKRKQLGLFFEKLSHYGALPKNEHDALIQIGQGRLTETSAKILENWFYRDSFSHFA